MDIYNLPPIIGFAGKKGSGKDFALKCLREVYSDFKFQRISFADALKDEICLATKVNLDYLEAKKDKFRMILQWWGTDFRRNMFSHDYWIEKWKDAVSKVKMDTCTIIVATDVRFQNEVDIIKSLGGKVYFIYPRRYELPTDAHESELCAMRGMEATLINDFDNKQTLIDEIKKEIKA